MLWMMSILFLMEKFTKFVSTGRERENSVSFTRVIYESVQQNNSNLDSRKEKSFLIRPKFEDRTGNV